MLGTVDLVTQSAVKDDDGAIIVVVQGDHLSTGVDSNQLNVAECFSLIFFIIKSLQDVSTVGFSDQMDTFCVVSGEDLNRGSLVDYEIEVRMGSVS